MSIHIAAKNGEIAPVVLMPGDPLRAKFIADKMMKDVKLVSSTRNIFFFTGNYNGTRLSIGASGMGCPSIGIYSHELYADYDVQCIIRIGTCGGYLESLNLYDLINADTAYSESTFAQLACNYPEDHFKQQGNAYDIINSTAKKLDIPILNGPIHSGDAFYRVEKSLPKIATDNKCLAAEMEAFALFANAKLFKKSAACLLTVSDIIPSKKQISADQREKSLDVMAKLALESVIEIDRSL
ncbi:MAG TPA: purine-nucleoside phosphorylase [Chitinophagaceae bacterium]|nr:purine-nucleoside phosphorylase [Chitinophagaceae bacterium]